MDRNTYETLEYLFAEQAHESWSGWMRYLFSKGEFNDDGTWTMPAWAVERWQRQLATPFDDLSREEQESDVEEAQKYLRLILCPVRQGIAPGIVAGNLCRCGVGAMIAELRSGPRQGKMKVVTTVCRGLFYCLRATLTIYFVGRKAPVFGSPPHRCDRRAGAQIREFFAS